MRVNIYDCVYETEVRSPGMGVVPDLLRKTGGGGGVKLKLYVCYLGRGVSKITDISALHNLWTAPNSKIE